MSDHELSEDRKDALAFMSSRGWTCRREGRGYVFTKPDPRDSEWPHSIRIQHKALSLRAMVRKVEATEPDLCAAIAVARSRWLASVWPRHLRPETLIQGAQE